VNPGRILAVAVATALTAAQAAEEKSNMELVGFHDLQGWSAYQPIIHPQADRWIAYIGLHAGRARNALTGADENSGTAVLDVTDPRAPRLLAHIPGEAGGGAQMVRACAGASLPHGDKSKTYRLRTYGNSAHEVWDVTNPQKPALVTTVVKGLGGTHKNWWECDTGIAYLVSGVEGWRTHRMTQVYDLSDPARPRFIRNFGLAGQQPGARGGVPTGVHGMISTGPRGNRIYFGYGTNSFGVLQIVDRDKLLNGAKEPTEANLAYPQVGRLDLPSTMGAHTTFPMIGMEVAEFAKDSPGAKRDYALIVNESLAERCREPRQMAWIADITEEAKPLTVSGRTVPEAGGNFCSRGGRFGAHSSNESMAPVYYKRVVFITFFNAGVRALDVRDPYRPHEIGYYIPAVTDKTSGGVIQTNNVEVDERGYVYIVDRAGTGLHILRLQALR